MGVYTIYKSKQAGESSMSGLTIEKEESIKSFLKIIKNESIDRKRRRYEVQIMRLNIKKKRAIGIIYHEICNEIKAYELLLETIKDV